MKTIKYISIGLLFLIPTTGFAEWCNWGFVPPKVYECNGKKYVYGSAACDSGMYTNIFCEQSKSKNGAECRDDNEPATIECFNKNIAKSPPIKPEPKKPSVPKDEEGFCNWGFAGPQIYNCEGKEYRSGSAFCGSKHYIGLFCQDDLCGSSAACCAADESAQTMRCYENFQRTRRSGDRQSPAAPRETKPRGIL